MANLHETSRLIMNVKNKMKSVELNLKHFRALILMNEFDIGLWEVMNIRDINTMIQLMNQYKTAYCRLPELIDYYDFCHFYWHHLTDSFMRENFDWVQAHIAFLDQQIEHTNEMVQMCIREETRLNLLRAASQN